MCSDGQALAKRGQQGDMLDAVLKRNDTPGAALRTVYDPYNDEELTLSREELRVLMNIQQGKVPEVHINPYEDLVDWFSNEVDPTPLRSAPEPKRRFMPSKWEEKKIVKLVRHAVPVAVHADLHVRWGGGERQRFRRRSWS